MKTLLNNPAFSEAVNDLYYVWTQCHTKCGCDRCEIIWTETLNRHNIKSIGHDSYIFTDYHVTVILFVSDADRFGIYNDTQFGMIAWSDLCQYPESLEDKVLTRKLAQYDRDHPTDSGRPARVFSAIPTDPAARLMYAARTGQL